MLRETIRASGLALALACTAALAPPAGAEPAHGIAMFGSPALPPDFTHMPYANPDAPKGGRIVQGEIGAFDSLNPHILKGTAPWMLRFVAYESLMGRSLDEPFTLYGLLAESVETAPDRSWVEYTLRPEARFSDGTPVTVEDVIWSYETLGTVGHPRYLGTWDKVERIEQTGERSVRITFNTADDELALIMGMRPILKKAQWEGKDFTQSGLTEIPITTAPYVIDDFEAGAYVSLRRDPDYWGYGVVPYMAGQANIDEIRLEFFGDASVMFEAFKGGQLTTLRETNPRKWNTQYDFPAVRSGDVVLSEIAHERPSGIQGFVMNTRRPPFDDWRVREAMIQAFNFEFVNQVLNDGELPRIGSYFSNSILGMSHGPAEGAVRDLLEPFADSLLPGTIEGYALPVSDGSERNRAGTRAALDLLAEAGWTVGDAGRLRDADGRPFTFEILLSQSAAGASETRQIADLYAAALQRLGIEPEVVTVDGAQFTERTNAFDFDMTWYWRALSLSPGNEQKLYWGSEAAGQEGSRNWMGVQSEAIDALTDRLVNATDDAEFVATVKALDRVLTAGRYVVPIWFNPVSYLAHSSALHYPDTLPAYGDWNGFQPDLWWYEEG